MKKNKNDVNFYLYSGYLSANGTDIWKEKNKAKQKQQIDLFVTAALYVYTKTKFCWSLHIWLWYIISIINVSHRDLRWSDSVSGINVSCKYNIYNTKYQTHHPIVMRRNQKNLLEYWNSILRFTSSLLVGKMPV